MLIRFDGRTAIVAGAARGIGQTIARSLASDGARVQQILDGGRDIIRECTSAQNGRSLLTLEMGFALARVAQSGAGCDCIHPDARGQRLRQHVRQPVQAGLA